jgi:hypothetical protein
MDQLFVVFLFNIFNHNGLIVDLFLGFSVIVLD